MLPATGHIVPAPLKWRPGIAESRVPRRTFWGAFGKMFMSIVALQLTSMVLIKWMFGNAAVQDGPVKEANLPLFQILIVSVIVASAYFQPFIAGRLSDIGMTSKWPRRAYVSLIGPLILVVISLVLWVFESSSAMTFTAIALLTAVPAHILFTFGLICGLVPSQSMNAQMVPPETEVTQ